MRARIEKNGHVELEKVITALEERGVYAGALIKKRKYCPKGVPL